MKNKSITILIIAIVAFAGGYFVKSLSADDSIKSEAQVNLSNEWDSLSYVLGLSIGYQTTALFDQVSPSLVASGLNTVINDSSMFGEQTVMMLQGQLINRIMAKKAQEGRDFLADNKNRPGVFVTETGLQYEPLVEGDGPSPVDTSVVTVHYTGMLIDGTVFDSSLDDGEPATFRLNGVIRGWTEGLQLMSIGSKYKFYVPSELAYGQRPPTPSIPPNSVLIFEVELLDIR